MTEIKNTPVNSGLIVHHPSWHLSTRYKSVLPQRGNQSQPTFLLVLLFLSYQGFGFMKPSSGCMYTRTSKLYIVGGKGLVLYKYR
jgi:hypothetical protein